MPYPSSKKNEVVRPVPHRLIAILPRALRAIGKPLYNILVGVVFVVFLALLTILRISKVTIRIFLYLRYHFPQLINFIVQGFLKTNSTLRGFIAKIPPFHIKQTLHLKRYVKVYPPQTPKPPFFYFSSIKKSFQKIKSSNLFTTLVRKTLSLTKTASDIRAEAKKFYLRRISWLLYVPIIAACLLALTTVASLVLLWLYIFKDLPLPATLATRQPNLTTRIFDRRGQLLFKFYKNENRTLVSLSEIPPTVRQATIAIEDKDFYSHQGISYRGILRAIWKNLSSGTLTGGSTITQQLVKNSLLSSEKTWRRKIREAILAIKVEWYFPKDQILEMYLNQVPYGGNTYGIAEAAETYFGKRIQDLNLAEAAFLAGLPASPTEFSPYGSQPQLARSRQQEVLKKMVENNYITQKAVDTALSTKIKIRPAKTDILAPHFVMYIKDILSKKYGNAIVEQGGLQVYTSLDLDIQETAQKYLTDEIDKDRFLHVTNGAAFITKPQTGEILAMVGSRNYFDTQNDGNVNATLALRQPGSSIKPVNYAAALANGFTTATIIPDTPITFQIPGQPPYSPTNYDRRFHGNIPLRTALGSSYNVPAVKVLSAIGVFRMIEQGKKMGITTWDDPSRFGLSLTLGGGEVKMVDLATAYGSLANLGDRVDLQPILRIDDSHGHVIEKLTCTDANLPLPSSSSNFTTKFIDSNFSQETVGCNKQLAVDPKIAFILGDILADNAARTPAFGPNSDLVIPNHRVSVKTGTTNDLKDNWTIGFTPDFLVATWVGNFDGSPMSYVASGITGASPIWNKIMTSLLSGHADSPVVVPPDIVKVEICSLTGTLACSACPNNRTEYFLPNTVPTQTCTDSEIQRILQAKQESGKKLDPSPTPILD